MPSPSEPSPSEPNPSEASPSEPSSFEIVAPEDTPDRLIVIADEATVRAEVEAWRARVLRRPGLWDKATRGTQDRINRLIPERVHAIVTSGVEAMTKGIMTGSDLVKARPLTAGGLAARELKARKVIQTYRTTASVEGGVAGGGGASSWRRRTSRR